MVGILLNEECKATGRERRWEREREKQEGSTGDRVSEREGKAESKQLTMHKLGRVRIGEICGEIN